MEASVALARVGGTTGEWGAVMREVFGEFRAPTGISSASGAAGGLADRGAGFAPFPVARHGC